MSKPINHAEEIINPKNVKWKYFTLNEKSEIICADQQPMHQPIIAILNTSTWFAPRAQVPAAMKSSISTILNKEIDGKKLNLCVAVPCCPLSEMQEYYGKTDFYDDKKNRIEDDYVQIRMHDDLRKGDVDFIKEGFGQMTRSMPSKEGAQQIASAIEKGYNIWTYSGGGTITPKLWLCEKYFASKADQKEQNKPYLIGFSNVSASQLYLRGLITPVHYLGLYWAIYQTKDDEICNLIFKACEGQKGLTHQRILKPNNLEEVEERCQKMIKDQDVITNLTVFPYNLGATCDSIFPKFKDGEKIILGFEGFFQDTVGRNIHEVLFKALEYGAINPDQILFIVIEDIIHSSEMLEIRRINGLIPDFSELKDTEQKSVEALARKLKISAQEYIKKSNAATFAEIARIEEVAAKYGIPVVHGGQKRAGHSKDPAIQLFRVSQLEFNQENGEIIQTSSFDQEKTEALFADAKKDPHRPALDWSSLALSSKLGKEEITFSKQKFQYNKTPCEIAQNPQAEEEIKKAKLRLLNSDNENLESEAVIAGNALNIVELDVDKIKNKGIVIYISEAGNSVSELYQIMDSPQFLAAKFVILSMEIPESLKDQERENYLESRYNYFQKLFADCKIEKPSFITKTSMDESKLSTLFSAQINVKEMLKEPAQSPNPQDKKPLKTDERSL